MASKHKKRAWLLCASNVFLSERDANATIRAVRRWINRGWVYGKPINPVWQIRKKINRGRY